MPRLEKSPLRLTLENASPEPTAETVLKAAQSRLKQQDFRFSRCVTCSFHEGVLILRGSVPTYYLKQMAQVAVARVEGVQQIDNRIEVMP